MAGSNEGNEGNEGNAGSIGGAAGGGFGVLPDRLDLPFIAEPNVADARLGGTVWKPEAWDGAWAAWMVLTDFAQAVPLSHDGSAPPRRRAWVIKPPDPAKGTVAFDPHLPVLPDARIGGEYKLVYTDGDGFKLTGPDGDELGIYDFVANTTNGEQLSITNEINLVITRGANRFSNGDEIRIGCDFVQCIVTPRLQGNAANKGECVLDANSPLLAGARLGRYSLRLTARNASQSTFRLADGSNTQVDADIRWTDTTNPTYDWATELKFRLKVGNARFAVDDGFDIDIRRSLWLDPPPFFQSNPRQPPVKAAVITKPQDATKGTLTVRDNLPAAFGAKCNNGVAGFGTYKVICTAGPATARTKGKRGDAARATTTVTDQGTFKVIDPHGLHLGWIKLPADADKPGRLINQLGFVLRSGTTAFDPGDIFEVSVSRTGMTVVRTNGTNGTPGNGGLTLRPGVVTAEPGVYQIACTQTAANGGRFTITGEASPIDFPNNAPPGGTTSFRGKFPFDIVDGTADFIVGDAFTVTIDKDATTNGGDEAELRELILAAEDERADALGEILAQHESFIAYFMAALGVSPRTHPNTCQLLHIGSLLGAYVSMHFKRLYQRRRPSSRAPALMPPIPVPGHPAYPSGHSTQAHLMALCVLEGLPGAARGDLRPVLMALAARIARNREIAGLHFESDTRAGAVLAADTFHLLNSSTLAKTDPSAVPPAVPAWTKTRFEAVVAKARDEWK